MLVLREKKLNTNDLVKEYARTNEITLGVAREKVNSLLSLINVLIDGNKSLLLESIGSFKWVVREPTRRKLRGEWIDVPAKETLVFNKSSKIGK
jgi:nucleoid DNA-binding protein